MYMKKIGEHVYQIMNNNKDVLILSGVCTNMKRSHCTMLLYYDYPVTKKQSSLGFHTGCIYMLAYYQYNNSRNT